mgnify:CR=1 FL=1
MVNVQECNGSILVDGIDCGTSVKVVSGRDLVFLVKVPGYRVNVVLLGGTQPISAASDGTYTIMNITKDYQVTIMVTKVSNLDVTFETIGTKVTVGGVDYSDNVYSAQYNEEITFRVVSELNNAPVTVTAESVLPSPARISWRRGQPPSSTQPKPTSTMPRQFHRPSV